MDGSPAMPPPPRPLRWHGAWLAALFAAAFLVRAAVIVESAKSPYHEHLVLDAGTYHQIATRGDPAGPFWQPPGYPWFLRAVYRAFGRDDPALARWVQALFGAAACLSIAAAGSRLGRPRAGLAAGWAAAFYGPLVYFDNEILPASPGVLLAALIVLLLSGRVPPGTGQVLAAGAVLGAGGVLLPPLAVPGALLAAWLARRSGWRRAALFLLVAAVPVGAVAWRNARYGEGFIPVSYNGGINFWIGNNPDYPSTVAIRPGMAWNELTEQPRCRGGARTRAAESAWFYRQGLRFATRRPLSWLGIVAWKTAATLSVREIGRNRDIYDAREESAVMRALLLPWGFPFVLLGPLAAAGTAALVRRRTLPAPPALMAAGVLAACVLFFPTARYRAPALPALLLLAALGLPAVRARDLPAAAVVLGLGFVPPGIPPIPRAETSYNIGMSLSTAGRPRAALAFYEEALERDPGHADAHWARAAALAKLGRDEEARAELLRTLELDPGASLAWQALGAYHRRQGNLEAARACLARAVAADPCNRVARALLAHALLDLGLYRAARRELDEARRIYPRRDRSLEEAERRYRRLTGAR